MAEHPDEIFTWFHTLIDFFDDSPEPQDQLQDSRRDTDTSLESA